jgi:hypothetical protein
VYHFHTFLQYVSQLLHHDAGLVDEAMSTVYMIDALGHYTCMATFLAMLKVYRRQRVYQGDAL